MNEDVTEIYIYSMGNHQHTPKENAYKDVFYLLFDLLMMDESEMAL